MVTPVVRVAHQLFLGVVNPLDVGMCREGSSANLLIQQLEREYDDELDNDRR